VNSAWLEFGAVYSVPLIFGLLRVAFGLVGIRAHRRPCLLAAQRSKPEQRANTLLKEWLCPEQRITLERRGYFEVTGSHTGKRYRIRRHRQMNIDELGKDGARIAVLCFGPVGNLPLGDVMLTQKLALETNEQTALAVANRFDRRAAEHAHILRSALPRTASLTE
jgi:hypothetical protein